MGHLIKNWATTAPEDQTGTLSGFLEPPATTPNQPTPADLDGDPGLGEAQLLQRDTAGVEAALAAARREGFAAGHADAVARAAGLLADAEAEAERALEGAADAALAPATKMAERIVGRAVTLDPTVMAEIAAEALSGCRTGEPSVRIRVHPEDLGPVEARREWLESRASGVRIQLAADETVGRYGCLIDTARGRIDGRLEAQIAALAAAARGEDDAAPGSADG